MLNSRAFKITVGVLATLLILLAVFALSIILLDDAISQNIRFATEGVVNGYVDDLSEKATNDELNTFDRSFLHSSISKGIMFSRGKYPEASTLLQHFVYGDGSDLELSSDYFKDSPYLQAKVSELGEGEHGPISLTQEDDLRLAMAVNPYYLSIDGEKVRLYNPNVTFGEESSDRIMSIVPIGKLQVNIYDELVTVMDPEPFYVFSEWVR